MNTPLSITDELLRSAVALRAERGDTSGLRERVLAAASVERQRWVWRVRAHQALAMPERRTALIVTVVLLLLTAGLTVALVASRIDRPTPSLSGSLAYLAGGALYVAGSDGGSPRLLWEAPSGVQLAEPLWLDHGNILVEGSSETHAGVYRVNVANQTQQLMGEGGLVDVSPDRTQLAIVSGQGTAPRLRIVNAATGALVREFPTDLRMALHDWSPDGQWLIGETPESIYRISIANGQVTQLVTGLCCGLSPHWPRWSPDSSRIVYVDYHVPENPRLERAQDCTFRCGSIWTVGAVGGVRTRLTPELGSEILPAFSPDGRWLAYIAENVDGIRQRDELVVVAANGTGRHVLTLSPELALVWHEGLPDGHRFEWDPDSRGLLYLNFEGRLWHITLDGRESPVGTPLMEDFSPQISP